MPTVRFLVLLVGFTALAEAKTDKSAPEPATAPEVAAIKWASFKQVPDSPNAKMLQTILTRSSKYLVEWLADKPDIPLAKNEEVQIRPIAYNASSLAVLLHTHLYDPNHSGISAGEAEALVWRCVHRLCQDHKANGGNWGDAWQSPLWVAYGINAAWLCWPAGSAENRQLALNVLIHEADRIMDRPPPAWNGEGGNTRAEENAWDALIVELAAVMLPSHPHQPCWQEQAIRYRLNAVAAEKDLTNGLILHGRAVKDWITGYNLFADGSLVNHRIHPHPDYINAPLSLSGEGSLYYALAGRKIPEANRYNSELLYQSLVTVNWPSPPYAPPGGTVLSADGTVYWPTASREQERANRHYKWSGVGVWIRYFDKDRLADLKGDKLAEVFLAKTLAQQQPDGRTGEAGDQENNPLKAFAQMYLGLWLQANGAICFSNQPVENL